MNALIKYSSSLCKLSENERKIYTAIAKNSNIGIM